MLFKQIEITGWRQYRAIDVTLHPKLTILTGANGAGKTTILNLLSRHFGWHGQFISTPRRRKSDIANLAYFSDYWSPELRAELMDFLEKSENYEVVQQVPDIQGPEQEIGKVIYSGDIVATVNVPTTVGSTYDVIIRNQQGIRGLHIPSHRPLYAYQAIASIPAARRRREDLFNEYSNIVRQRYYNQHHHRTPNYFIKETLISLATFGYGNAVVEADPEALALFEEFQNILSLVLPPKMGFQRLSIRIPEVVLVTESGDFSIDAVSGGISAIIDLAWQLFMYAPPEDEFVVTIDEPENHLHPELQRSLLPSLLRAFPNVQFIVATHNPFIVSSVPDSNVYAFDYDISRRVYSSFLDTVNRAGSSNDILRDVLGIDFSIPLWVEHEINDILESYSKKDFTSETLSDLRKDLGKVGLEKYIPTTITLLAERLEKQ